MASFRKKPQHIGGEDNDPPVMTAPTAAARLPEPSTEQAAPESNPVEQPSAVEEAAQNAMQQRVREMQHAAEVVREATQHQPQYAAEPHKAPEVPAHIQQWAAAHPEYLNDHVKVAELQLALAKCTRDGLTWDKDDFVPTVERHLGLRQQAPSNGNGSYKEEPQRSIPRQATPVRQHYGPTVSAPPTREVPSMSTGRPMGGPTKLSPDEVGIALATKPHPQMTDREATELYANNKKKLAEYKASGQIQDG